jgi:hypothetical protein
MHQRSYDQLTSLLQANLVLANSLDSVGSLIAIEGAVKTKQVTQVDQELFSV